METCPHHEKVIEEMGKRPKMMSIWSVVGMLLTACIIVLTASFSSFHADVEKIQIAVDKIQESVAVNSLKIAVMQQDYTVWKKNAPPYHTHHTDGRITKP